MIRTGKKFSKPAMSRVINGDTILQKDPIAPEKIRLDILLVEQHPEYNRSSLQTFIKSGFVLVDGIVAQKPNQKYLPTAKITLNIPEIQHNHPNPETIYEDDNVLVLNKPAGLLSMAKGEYCPERTLADYGLIVHRLDRDTSGVVILAKNPATQTLLRKQFQDRKTHKTYYAIVEGRPKLDEALIDLPIARNIKHPTTFLVDASGKPSQTHYKVIATSGKYSLLELKPISGRTHQLRVHLKYLGTPILGDPVYGSHKSAKTKVLSAEQSSEKTVSKQPKKHRLFLHAASLEITIPAGQRKTFSAPLPPEFHTFFPEG